MPKSELFFDETSPVQNSSEVNLVYAPLHQMLQLISSPYKRSKVNAAVFNQLSHSALLVSIACMTLRASVCRLVLYVIVIVSNKIPRSSKVNRVRGGWGGISSEVVPKGVSHRPNQKENSINPAENFQSQPHFQNTEVMLWKAMKFVHKSSQTIQTRCTTRILLFRGGHDCNFN